MVELQGTGLQTPGSIFEDTSPDGTEICSFLEPNSQNGLVLAH